MPRLWLAALTALATTTKMGPSRALFWRRSPHSVRFHSHPRALCGRTANAAIARSQPLRAPMGCCVMTAWMNVLARAQGLSPQYASSCSIELLPGDFGGFGVSWASRTEAARKRNGEWDGLTPRPLWLLKPASLSPGPLHFGGCLVGPVGHDASRRRA